VIRYNINSKSILIKFGEKLRLTFLTEEGKTLRNFFFENGDYVKYLLYTFGYYDAYLDQYYFYKLVGVSDFFHREILSQNYYFYCNL
jgi:hypothetical protein